MSVGVRSLAAALEVASFKKLYNVTAAISDLVASAERFITSHFDLNQIEEAYADFAGAAETDALKVVLTHPAFVQTNDGGT